jgi:DNA-directed RNA polymerase specialized sigma24 family protein
VFLGAQRGNFDLEDRHALWGLLAHLALRKAQARAAYHFAQKRGGGRVVDEAAMEDGIEAFPGAAPGPEELTQGRDLEAWLLELLDDAALRDVAVMTLAGYTPTEIATHLDRTERTVRRRLELIRTIWERELKRDSG